MSILRSSTRTVLLCAVCPSASPLGTKPHLPSHADSCLLLRPLSLIPVHDSTAARCFIERPWDSSKTTFSPRSPTASIHGHIPRVLSEICVCLSLTPLSSCLDCTVAASCLQPSPCRLVPQAAYHQSAHSKMQIRSENLPACNPSPCPITCRLSPDSLLWSLAAAHLPAVPFIHPTLDPTKQFVLSLMPCCMRFAFS